jgi:hypothetical protein
MAEQEERKGWSFPAGSVGHDESVKDYAVEATDGQVGSVSWRHAVTLGVTVAEVKATPTHEHPEAPVDWALVEQFDRGMLGGGGLWPYTDD